MTDEELIEKLEQCVRCGTCKTMCPTYGSEHDETLSGRGRLVILKGILAGDLAKKRQAMDKVLSCIQCGACAQRCPLGLEIPELIYSGRTRLREVSGSGAMLRVFTRLFLNHPDRVVGLSRLFRKPVEGYLRRRGLVPEKFSLPHGKVSFRSTPVSGTEKKKGTVLLFSGCSTRYLYPHLGQATVRVLSRLGYDVVIPEGEVCCGSPFRTLGMEKEAIMFMKKNLEIFGAQKALATVSLCPTCVLSLKKESLRLLGSGVDNVMDISQFLFLYESELIARKPERDTGRNVYYHDPCHMKYGLGLVREPRAILESCGLIPGAQVSDTCCGFGGTFSIRYSEVSFRLAMSSGDKISSSGAEDVYTACPGCIHQLRKVVQKRNVYHVIEAVERSLNGRF